jgi:hypothetical protein
MRKMSIRFRAIFFVVVICVSVFLTMVLYRVDFVAEGALGPADLPLAGWLWSSNAGWMSFCGGQDMALCPGTTTYQVVINNDTGEFSGYAWADGSLGWLSFNKSETRTPPEPPFNDASTFTAKITPGGSGIRRMEGWGRFLAGCDFIDSDGNGIADRCASSGPGANSGGWDGWVRFSSGTAQDGTPYEGFVASASGTSGILTGYAWGSEVVGWMRAGTTGNYNPPPQVQLPTIGVNLTANPNAPTGNAPLTITFIADVTTDSSLPITYDFDCDNGITQSTTTINRTASFKCTYNVGSYQPNVEVRQNGAFATVSDQSYVTNIAGGGNTIQARRGIIIEIPPDE